MKQRRRIKGRKVGVNRLKIVAQSRKSPVALLSLRKPSFETSGARRINNKIRSSSTITISADFEKNGTE